MSDKEDILNDLFTDEEVANYGNLVTLIDRFANNSVQFYVPKGWYPLVNELVGKLEELGLPYSAEQVKDKFGGLRFYASISRDKNGDMIGDSDTIDEFYSIINDYETKSFAICEHCGSRGRAVSYKGWIRTECRDCSLRSRVGKTLLK